MSFSGSLWWTVIRPDFIVEDGNVWLISWWMCSIYYSVIKFSFLSSNDSSWLTSAPSISCSCVSIRWVPSLVFSIGLIWSYGYSKWNELTFGLWQAIVAWRGSVLGVSVFLLNPFGCVPFLWLFWRSCYLAEFLFMKNGPLKGKLSSFPSCCINKYLKPLLLSPHPIFLFQVWDWWGPGPLKVHRLILLDGVFFGTFDWCFCVGNVD